MISTQALAEALNVTVNGTEVEKVRANCQISLGEAIEAALTQKCLDKLALINEFYEKCCTIKSVGTTISYKGE